MLWEHTTLRRSARSSDRGSTPTYISPGKAPQTAAQGSVRVVTARRSGSVSVDRTNEGAGQSIATPTCTATQASGGAPRCLNLGGAQDVTAPALVNVMVAAAKTAGKVAAGTASAGRIAWCMTNLAATAAVAATHAADTKRLARVVGAVRSGERGPGGEAHNVTAAAAAAPAVVPDAAGGLHVVDSILRCNVVRLVHRDCISCSFRFLQAVKACHLLGRVIRGHKPLRTEEAVIPQSLSLRGVTIVLSMTNCLPHISAEGLCVSSVVFKRAWPPRGFFPTTAELTGGPPMRRVALATWRRCW